MNTPHTHAEFIAEAVKDMSRGISKVRQSGMYEAVSLSDVINDSRGEFIFFFDDTPPVKPTCASPMTDDEIRKAVKYIPYCMEYYRAIANAAHARCLQDEANVREELIARYDSLQSQYAELSVASILGLRSLNDAPEPQTVTSTLSDDEIDAIWWSLKPVGNEMPSHHDIGRAIAIAAKIATIREIAAMSFDSSLLECNGGGFSAAAMSQFAGACVAEFQRTLLAGIGETK